VLTAILSLLVAVLGLIDICSGFMTEETAGIKVAAGTGREVLTYLVVGLLVSAFFYATSLLFGGILARRRRDWNYLRARIREGSDSTQQ
jgi:ABC-type Na+ efflux pump permease subunit